MIIKNKEYLNRILEIVPLEGEVKNYQVRYKFIKNSEKLNYLVVRVKFIGFIVKMKVQN
ncbi:hypothetical protein H3N56_02925 [Cetobacterium sp. 2A]|uniref:hypothetical protein n=1 Tax=Cetobacterium sp. 2A TaxID=2754723 RepID=UPI00163BA6ED|nr:hypothetical protein [Cetobacterium sp. 2A]MBC2855447.1 hypothetical protein [Cetobacterium sp. 2A]